MSVAMLLLMGVGAIAALQLVAADGISSHQSVAVETKDAESCQCGESKLSANISRTRAFAADAVRLVAELEAEVRRLKVLPAAGSSRKAAGPTADVDLLKRLEKANGDCGRRRLEEQEAITDEAKQWRGACSQLAHALQEHGRPLEIYLNATE